MNTMFKVERVTLVDRLVGFFMMLRWRVRKFFQRKPIFINNYIIRVK